MPVHDHGPMRNGEHQQPHFPENLMNPISGVQQKKQEVSSRRRSKTTADDKDAIRKLLTETEEERAKRLEYQRTYRQSETELSLKKTQMKEYQREYRKKKLIQETEEQRNARLEYIRQANRKFIERLSPEQYRERQKMISLRNKLRILEETPEQRQKRLDYQRNYRLKRKLNKSWQSGQETESVSGS